MLTLARRDAAQCEVSDTPRIEEADDAEEQEYHEEARGALGRGVRRSEAAPLTRPGACVVLLQLLDCAPEAQPASVVMHVVSTDVHKTNALQPRMLIVDEGGPVPLQARGRLGPGRGAARSRQLWR